MIETTAPPAILLVDDHPAVRQGLAALLAARGFPAVSQASTLQETCALLEATRVDLAVLDLSLEQGSGLDLVPELTNHGARVVVYSMFEDARTIRRAFEFGVLGYVTKRDEPADLIEAVQRVARGEAYLSTRAARAMDAAAAPTVGKELSERERQVLTLMGQGESNIGIAAALGISVRTVETYYTRISEKLDLPPSVRELRKRAIRYFAEEAAQPSALPRSSSTEPWDDSER